MVDNRADPQIVGELAQDPGSIVSSAGSITWTIGLSGETRGRGS